MSAAANAEDEDIDGICDAATTIMDPGIVGARSVIERVLARIKKYAIVEKPTSLRDDKHTEKVIRLVAALVKLDNEVRLHHPDLNRRLLQAACDVGELKAALHLAACCDRHVDVHRRETLDMIPPLAELASYIQALVFWRLAEAVELDSLFLRGPVHVLQLDSLPCRL
jgi:hypothetical protein